MLKGIGFNSWWTGGNDIESEGDWTWANSLRPVGDFVWHDGHPSHGIEENCLCFLISYPSYEGFDQSCTRQLNPICQLNI